MQIEIDCTHDNGAYHKNEVAEMCIRDRSDINVSEGTITVNRTIERIYIINGTEKYTELVINTPKKIGRAHV